MWPCAMGGLARLVVLVFCLLASASASSSHRLGWRSGGSGGLLARSNNSQAATSVAQQAALRQQSQAATVQDVSQVSLETLLCCIISLSWVFVIAGSWWRWSLCGQIDDTVGAGGEREYLLDNAKIFVQCFVVYGHFIYDGRSEVSTFNGVHNAKWLFGADHFGSWLQGVTSPYRMPLACFISGICSQGTMNGRRVRRFVQNLVIPTVMWIFLVKPLIHDPMMTMRPQTFLEKVNDLVHFQAFNAEWYLTALVLWRGSCFLVWSHLKPPVSFACMLAISCVAGYHDFDQGANKFLWLNAMFGFLPYFAFGYVFPFQAVCRTVPEPKVPLRAGVLAVAIVFSTAVLPGISNFPQGHCLYGGCPSDSATFPMLGLWDQRLYWSRRLARMSVEMLPVLTVLILVLPRSATRLSWAGPHTLYPFLFHNVGLAWEDILVKALPLPVITTTLGHTVVFLFHIPVVIGIVVCFASAPFRFLFSWCLEPKWISVLFEDEAPSSRKDQLSAAAALLVSAVALPTEIGA